MDGWKSDKKNGGFGGGVRVALAGDGEVVPASVASRSALASEVVVVVVVTGDTESRERIELVVAQSGKEISKSTLAQRARRERERILKQNTAQLSEQRLPSGKENSLPQDGKEISKSTLAQRARRERERILKQSITRQSEQHLLGDTRTQPLHEINIGTARDEHCANIGNNVRIREDTQRADTTAQARQKSSYADKGKGLLTYAMEKDTSLVEPLRDRNVGVEIHEERNVNIIRVREPSPSQLLRTRINSHPTYRKAIEKRQRVAQTSTSSSFMPNTTSTLHINRPTLTDQVDLCCEDEWEVFVNLEEPSRAHVIPGRHNLGNMDTKCTHCKALHWMDERLTKSSTSNPLFGTCCFQGKIRLPTLITPPSPIRALYDGDDDRSKSFRKHARGYNATNAFTSLGATLDPRVLTGSGPASVTIHGELRHRAGSLLPQHGKDANKY
ncbi:hypothetical protein RHGRI_014742 [Rhododendron griersonianum]|uniref:Uncharacterized protein n=1 Tax=Rhododendron griersonianum TaxID=479676 RepID=A0AAV6KB30_9ERIC|nr:hypothetical protein RHGRI_014742 [Rhododendron griersonianum]